MPGLVTFGDWYQSLSPNYPTGPKSIRDAAIRTRYGWVTLTRGKNADALMKIGGGLDIREKVILSDSATFDTYTPNDPLSAPMPQVARTAIQPFAFGHDKIVWTKNEEVLNGQSSAYGDSSRVMMYFDLMTKLETQLQVSIANGMENKFMARPTADMEGAAATEPKSLFDMVNEFPRSIYVHNGVSQTTKHTINPASAGSQSFRNHIFGYTSTAVNPAAGAKNIMNALDTASNRLVYDSPASVGFSRANQNWEDGNWAKKCCFWSYTGLEILMDLARQRNTTWTRTNELGMENPVYRGIEQYSLPGLESAAVYPSENATDTTEALGYSNNETPVTEGNATAWGQGPRGYIVDTTGTHAFFNKEVFFQRTAPRQFDTQPFTNVIWVDLYFAYMITAPWLSGVIAPGYVTGTFPAIEYNPERVYTTAY